MSEHETILPGNQRYRDERGRFRKPRFRPVDPLLMQFAKDWAMHRRGQNYPRVFVDEFAFLPTRRDHDARADFEATTRATVKGAP